MSVVVTGDSGKFSGWLTRSACGLEPECHTLMYHHSGKDVIVSSDDPGDDPWSYPAWAAGSFPSLVPKSVKTLEIHMSNNATIIIDKLPYVESLRIAGEGVWTVHAKFFERSTHLTQLVIDDSVVVDCVGKRTRMLYNDFLFGAVDARE